MLRIVLPDSRLKRAADEAGVSIVTGDTKVVQKGNVDRLFINTSGVGVIAPGVSLSAQNAQAGDAIIVTRNEICTALNQGDKFWLAIVLVDGEAIDGPHYIPQPFTQEPEPGATAVTFQLSSLLARARP